MLKTVQISSNKKTGPIAVTYRAGGRDTFNTCPKSCQLHPRPEAGATKIDGDYLAALLAAVPRGGQAWTYSHFPAELLPVAEPGQTVINASCDTMAAAVAAVEIGRPAVVVAPAGTDGPVAWNIRACNSFAARPSWPRISLANNAAAAARYVPGPSVIL
jgi:hypothetical protein